MALLGECCSVALAEAGGSHSSHRAVYLQVPKTKTIDIEFSDVKFSVADGRKRCKDVLRGVSGRFLSGELTAIMGPSGAGKSSLLNVITGVQVSGVTGSVGGVSVAAAHRGASGFRKESCYIMQDDTLDPLFTVHEIMTMAADFKLGSSVSTKAKQLVVEDILETLGLSATRETRCCRLSGGQRKRLSIALELVDNPPVLFLDEPTTGLDSSASLQVVSTLKALARGGRTVVCTIHQPSATVFELFDHVHVIARGRTVYQGSALNVVPFLQTAGLPCPKYHNPADFLMDVATGELGDHNDELERHCGHKDWRGERPLVKDQSQEMTDKGTRKAMVLVRKPSEFDRFWVLLHRSMIQLYRDWTVTHLKLALHFVVGIIFGLYFADAGWDGSKTISNFGFFMCTCVYLCYTSMMPAVLRFPQEMSTLKKEQYNNWYQLRTYYIAFIVANIPVQMVFCTVFTSMAYFISSQVADWSRFVMFLSVCQLLSIMAESIGLLLGTTCNPVNGTFLGAILTAVCLLFAGFLVFLSHMPSYLAWAADLNWMRYALEGLSLAIYGYGREPLECPRTEIYCHFRVPATLLSEVGMRDGRYWVDVSALSAMIVVLRLASFVTLRRKVSCNTR
ncbi:hypothetical protein ONE63_008822 [Megalurothrips usitatus]|uniref:ABC transporter domain-containing protein n=1 Tax=Megalurothrips usitatus TaxID=439358 RepID=A0AAV7XUC7_9NEOP|nr:hypothetical protein ONE63_008822 [Megalurothrips usitatus]